MSDFLPTESQSRAMAAIKQWYRDGGQQVFRLFGFAGTGKSTLLKHAINDLSLNSSTIISNDKSVPEVLYGTYTAKAALVLQKHGIPCRTISSLIYRVSEATEKEVAEAERKIEALERESHELVGRERFELLGLIAAKRQELVALKTPQFRQLNPDSDVKHCKLLVLDEVSMVDEEDAANILGFEKPVLVLGDPGQLPPIKGTGAFIQAKPDIMLTEIHRQAEESAIIRIATMARRKERIAYGVHDEYVSKMSKGDVYPHHLLKADQVICGKNATRLMLNNEMRKAAGFYGEFPMSPEEKVICLHNDYKLRIINGMFLSIHNPVVLSDVEFRAKVQDDSGKFVGNLSARSDEPQAMPCYTGHFLDHVKYDPKRSERDWQQKKGKIEATFGYAITCHKAQGSQWENIIVYDDHFGRSVEERARWLYTAITRAERGLVILD